MLGGGFDPCQSTEVRALELTEPSLLGFSASDLYSRVSPAYAEINVLWNLTPAVTPRQDTISIRLGEVVSVEEVVVQGDRPDCHEGAWVELAVEADIASADGELAASCRITLSSLDGTVDGTVVFAHACTAEVTGAHLAALQRQFDPLDSMEIVGAGQSFPDTSRQEFGVQGRGTWTGDGSSLSVGVVYYCVDDGSADCFVPHGA